MLADAQGSFSMTNGTLTANVGASALTVAVKTLAGTDPTAADPVSVVFRNATLATGNYTVVSITAALSLVVSSGSTLGSVSAVAARYAVLAINNAGAAELAIVNTAGGVTLDESNLISTTAEGGAGAADSISVAYSATARTSVPYKVVAAIDATEATAGTWATAPSAINLVGAGMTSKAVSSWSMVRLNTANGYGSTNTAIRRFLTTVTNQGTDITYADSATLGGTFTINTNGVYAISYSDNFSVSSTMGISLNSSQLTTSILTITVADILNMTQNSAANLISAVSWNGYLKAGDVVRAHDAATTTGIYPTIFTITRVA